MPRVLAINSATASAIRVLSCPPPAEYDLGTSELTLDTAFVDLVGLSSERGQQYIFGTSNGRSTGVLGQSANDVRIENLTVECTRPSGMVVRDSTDPAAYFPLSPF